MVQGQLLRASCEGRASTPLFVQAFVDPSHSGKGDAASAALVSTAGGHHFAGLEQAFVGEPGGPVGDISLGFDVATAPANATRHLQCTTAASMTVHGEVRGPALIVSQNLGKVIADTKHKGVMTSNVGGRPLKRH